MALRAGIPNILDVNEPSAEALRKEHARFNDEFLSRHAEGMRSYGTKWIANPLHHWSRQWEYPFAAERLIAYGRRPNRKGTRILDAGSGVTYFDYFVCDALTDAQVVCCDYDASYHAQFTAINATTPGSRVSFIEGDLQKLAIPDGDFDSVCCLSVLEHTDRYDEILAEFARVLRPGGQLVLTFDLSLDGRFELSFDQASAVLNAICRRFAVQDGISPITELERMKQPDGLLSTDHYRRIEPDLLPWKHPLLKGLHDLIKGRGWTGGFRSKSVFCLDARRM